MKGFKVHHGGGGGKGTGGALKELPVDTKMVIFEAGLYLVSHCLAVLKNL